MDMIKIGILGIAGVLMALLVREWKPQFSTLISMASCTLIFFCAISRIQAMAGAISQLVQYISLKESYLKILLKIVGIAYIADFSASICRDAGYSAVAGQIELSGKISVLSVSTPIVLALLNTISEYLT
ncbi:SpoIIIAC/SpoIIIAD family protein [Marvinbryantia formatexigens]|nr:SpoIIIAC/SpoIIIAD family protein [Marvinbryantia formatexigens]UWO24942.1 stage III sporulation protein AD [Marvinbryantia formatexigens DSM 14469]SDG24659.1 stage III sporulation protein AD [Marvinbryantia formatexigens]